MRKALLIVGVILTVLWGIRQAALFGLRTRAKPAAISPESLPSPQPIPSDRNLAYPIADFLNRITKKPFGIYVTAENSPIRPERFSGYHTGVDVEYEDRRDEIPVFAVYDGEIIEARWVSGYGGAIALRGEIDNRILLATYGHLSPDSLAKPGPVAAGEKIAVLGRGFSQETDFERRHLHFALKFVLINESLDWRGYAENEAELENWENPIAFFEKYF